MLSKFSAFYSKNWTIPCEVHLNDLLNVGKTYTIEKNVTKNITTNRTNIPGNDILSTPGMIETMDLHVCNIVNNVLKKECASVVSKIKCYHKAPLKIGEKFIITAKVEQVNENNTVFHVVCNNMDKVVIGDAHITVNAIGIKSK